MLEKKYFGSPLYFHGYHYYSIVLTINPNSTDACGKTEEYISSVILKWAKKLKLQNITNGPYYDIGEKENHHVNLTIMCKNKKSINEIRDIYFKSWINRKGKVLIQYLENDLDILKWNLYAKRNDIKDPNKRKSY
jgi:hypothetical protein